MTPLRGSVGLLLFYCVLEHQDRLFGDLPSQH